MTTETRLATLVALMQAALRLVRLMGHGSKHDVYGNYIDGLENDYWDVLNCFGKR